MGVSGSKSRRTNSNKKSKRCYKPKSLANDHINLNKKQTTESITNETLDTPNLNNNAIVAASIINLDIISESSQMPSSPAQPVQSRPRHHSITHSHSIRQTSHESIPYSSQSSDYHPTVTNHDSSSNLTHSVYHSDFSHNHHSHHDHSTSSFSNFDSTSSMASYF